MENLKVEEIDKKIQDKREFILKASECDYNFLWKCQHPDQNGKKCEKICEYYNPKKYD